MTLQEQLDEALTARHKLLTGGAMVSVGFGQRRVDYTPANLAALESYIADLRRQISGVSRGRSRVRYVVPG